MKKTQAPTPTPSTPPPPVSYVEKALPIPLPNPAVALSVTPSPPAIADTSPPTIAVDGPAQPGTPALLDATVPDTIDVEKDSHVVPVEPQQTTFEPKVEGPALVSSLEKAAELDLDGPPPPTPPKSEDESADVQAQATDSRSPGVDSETTPDGDITVSDSGKDI